MTAPLSTPLRLDPRALRLVVVPLVLFVATLAVRLVRLGTPRSLVFDEVFYASDGLDLVQHGVVGGRPGHPPLGTWLIGAGIEVFGFTPTGWRVAALVAGAALVVVAYFVALALTDSLRLALLAGVFVAVDGITFSMGRLAMLDGFLALFLAIAGGLAVVAMHRQRVTTAACVGAGVALGCAIAVKWSAAPVALVVLVMFLLADPRIRRGGWRPRVRVALALVALPAAVYVAVYIPWMVEIDETPAAAELCEDDGPCDPSAFARVDAWVGDQWDMFEAQREFSPTYWQAEPAWTWITYPTPTAFFRKWCTPEMGEVPEIASDGTCPTGAHETSLVWMAGIGNPVLWAAAAIAGLSLVVDVFRRRDRTAASLLALVAAIWVPWLFSSRDAFGFYAAALVPILAWWVVVALSHRPRLVKVGAPVLGVAAVVAFAWYYPAMVGIPLDPGDPRLVYPFWI